ncbi:CHAT domain-containing protein [Streptomyces sp. GC420]|uniref:CHAT domain-containing protein n=1 Tax=Streptomyces sp. GC420 TaxID=2697568 RepID=UPI001414E146|nr:CHAT domain-containing protein [Streptomyces sp. GC420]NBM16220.1 CHAT domain-containing protein [Streptomyces sp. GC420]
MGNVVVSDDGTTPDDVERVRSLLEGLPRGHPHRVYALDELGRALRQRFGLFPDTALIEEAVERHRAAHRLAPLGDEVVFQVNLAHALLDAYEARIKDTASLEEAYGLLRSALESGGISQADEPTVLASLATVLDRRWDRYGREEDLLACVEHHRRAAKSAEEQGHPRTALFCANLSDALLDLFSHSSDRAHLAEAVRAADRAMAAAPPGHPDLTAALDSACRVGEQQFEQDGDVAHLRRAEGFAEQACSAPRESQGADRGSLFDVWANVLRTWHGATGEPYLLDRAIAAQREAVKATPPRNMNRAGILANMATTYWRHAKATGDRTFLPEAYDLYRKAISGAPGARSAALHRSNLASMLSEFSDVFATMLSMTEQEVLDLAVKEEELAADALPMKDAQRRRYTLGIAVQLAVRYDERHRMEDFERAVRLLEENLQAADTEAEAARYRLGIAWMWRMRALHTLDPSDLTSAETAHRHALDAYRGVPAQLEVHLKYGLAMVLRFSAEGWIVGGRPFTGAFVARYQEATELYRWCALHADGLVQDRIRRADAWARAAAHLQNWPEALEAYRLAFSLVPLLAPQHLSRPDREQLLTNLDGVAADAAACALSMGDPYAALEFLESGRGLFLTESLGLREELAKLDTHAPQLGRRFLQLRAEVTASGVGTAWSRDGSEAAVEQELMDAELSANRARATELQEVLGALRKVPGLNRFLLPPDARDLVDASMDATGTVVVINVSGMHCDALIVRDGTVRVLPLPDLTWHEALRRSEALQRSTWRASDRSLSVEERALAEQELSAVLDWLWRTAARPVLDDLDRPRPTRRRAQALPTTENLRPRVWWCATGVLSGMPFHAASPLSSPAQPSHPGTGSDSVIDRVVSSYTPTLSVLAYSRDTLLGSAPKVLAVGIKDTPGHPKLAAAHLEVQAVCRWAPNAAVLRDEEASRDMVLAGLRSHDWVHFAGHAEQDPSANDNGHLVCHDHATAGPLTTADIADAQSAYRSFLAYLAACDTARGRANLTDQAMHLAGGVQSAGFTHVVASFWPLQSNTSLLMTRAFYKHLDGQPVTHDAVARAVDHAVRAAREGSPGRPSWWTSLHHVGP